MPYVFRWPGLARAAEDHPEPLPPRPQRQDPGPVTAPRVWAPMGCLDPQFDPCGAPPLKSRSDEKGSSR